MTQPDEQFEQTPKKIGRAPAYKRAWRKVASVLRGLSDPVLAYHSLRLQRNMGQSASKHIFVCGLSRAGTSLLSTILECNSAVASMKGESAFFSKRNFSNLVVPDIEQGELRQMGFAAETRADLFDAIGQRVLDRKNGATRYLDKLPAYVLRLELIRRMFPASRIVMMMREPRDGFMSFERHPGLSPITPDEYAKHWNDVAEAILKMRGESGIMLLTYEELCNDAEAKARQICEFVDLPFEEAMLDPEAHARVKGLYSAATGHGKIGKPISASSIGGWQEQLPAKDAERIVELCSKNMALLGYEV